MLLKHRSQKPPVGSFTLNRKSPQARGLKFWVPVLGQGSPNSLRDLSGHVPEAGTAIGSPAIVGSGKRGQVLDLERGSTQHIDYGIQNMLDVGVDDTPASISTWFNLESFPAYLQYYQVFCIADNSGGEYPFSIAMDFRDEGTSVIGVGCYDLSAGGAQAAWAYGANLTTGVWYHALGGYDGSYWRLFVNGVEVASTESAIGPYAYKGTEETVIGDVNTNDRGYDGLLSDIRCYHTAPTAALAQHIYQNPWDLYQPVSPKIYPGAWVDQPEQIANSVAVPIAPYLIKQKSNKPPSGAFELNKSSPQAKGLLRAWPLFANSKSTSVKEIVQDTIDGNITGASWVTDQFARGLQFTNNNDHEVRTDQIQITRPLSVAIWARRTGTANFRMMIGSVAGAGTGNCYINSNSARFQFRAGQTFEDVVYTSSPPSPFGYAASYIATCDVNGDGTGYIDGQGFSNSNSVTQTVFHFDQIGQAWDNDSLTFDGVIYDVRLYNRVLTQGDAIDHYQNPWDLYQPVPPKVYPSVYVEPPDPTESIHVPALIKHRSSKPPSGAFELNTESPQAKGLFGWWPGLGSRGANVLRSFTDRGPDGSFVNAPVWNNKGGQVSYYLNGSSDSINLGSSGWPSWSTGFSIVAFCYVTDLTRDNRVIAKWGSDADEQNYVLWMDTGGGGDGWAFHVKDDLSNFTTVGDDDSSAIVNTWQWVVATYDGSSDLAIYVDGRLQDSGTGQNPPGTGTCEVHIGRVPTNDDWYLGNIAEVRYYNRELSAAEVLDQYQNPWDLYRPVRPRIYPSVYVEPPDPTESIHVPALIKHRSSKPPSGAFELNKSSPQARGLVGWWPLRGSGSFNQKDFIRGNNLSQAGGTAIYQEPSGNRGLSHYIDGSNSSSRLISDLTMDRIMSAGESYTFSLWFKRNGAQQPYGQIWAADYGGGGWYEPFYCLFDSSGIDDVEFGLVQSDYAQRSIITTGDKISDLTWYLYILRANQSNTTIYLDIYKEGGGKIFGGSNSTWNGTFELTSGGGRVFTLGDDQQGWNQYAKGWWSDLRIYKMSLSDAEILDLYQNPWDLYRPVPPKVYPSVYVAPPAQIADAIIKMPRHRSQKP